MTPLYLGVDFGTSGCRSSVINDQAQEVHAERLQLPAPVRDGHSSSHHCSSQGPNLWWDALIELLNRTLSAIDAQSVQGIAIDGTSGTLLLCDSKGEPTSAALMYDDSRATEAVGRIRDMAGEDCAAATATSSLAKLIWLVENASDERARHALHQADWLSNRLCGRFGTSDENNALKLGYDPVHRQWPGWLKNDRALGALLPKVLEPGKIIGSLRVDLASELGLRADTRIIAGTTDSTAAFIAAGAFEQGDAVTCLGTTLVIKVLADQPIIDMGRGIYSHRLGDHWIVGGASNSGGGVLKHYFSDEEIAELTAQIDPSHCTGLDYYPLISSGERFPINDPSLSPRLIPRPNDEARFFQGMLEGIAGIERAGYQSLSELGAPYPQRIFTTGGGSVSEPWRAIRESLIGRPCPPALHSQAAYGSALLARSGTDEKPPIAS